MEFNHKSVLLRETLEYLRVKPDGVYVDGTMGGAGHSYEIGQALNENGHLIGIDQDEAAVLAGRERLKGLKCRVSIIRDNYSNIKNRLTELGIKGVDGILLDLGVSSYQLDTPERGFSYWEDEKLDMRMDQRNPLSAREVVNQYSEAQLYHIIRDYGEDRFAKNIAKHIVSARQEREIETTARLTEIIKGAIPMKVRKTGGHPARRTFQAIRIEVNKELYVLENTIETMADLLNENGRLAIITFHSLEDRIVKRLYRKMENPCTCPKDFPVCICGNISKGCVVTKKPVVPGEKEQNENPRARSAMLRVFEKKGL